MKAFFHFKKYRTERGFSLPELIVTIAIISLMTAIVLFRYSSFNSGALLQSQAYEMALDLRQTQVFGLSVRSEGSSTNFREEYGLYFDSNNSGQYIFFQDSGSAVPASRASDGSEDLNVILLDPRYRIDGICVNSGCTSINDVSITFKRPNFDALFRSSGFAGTIDEVSVTIAPVSDSTKTRTVNITNTGQISVQ